MKRKKHTRKVEFPDVTIETSNGTVVRCLPIANSLQAIRNTVELPSPPTYQMTDVAGSVIDVEYDQAAIDDENTPQEDKDAWKQYQKDLAEATRQRNDRIYALVIKKGIEVVKGTTIGQFCEELHEMGIDPPADKTKLRRLHADVEIFSCPQDFTQVMVGISMASGVNEEAIREAEERLFRPVGELDGQDTGSDSGDPGTGSEETA